MGLQIIFVTLGVKNYKDINSRELDEFDHYCAFRANEIIVLFFKKNDKFYCQIVKNGSEKYEKLYLQEIWEETLNAWKNIL